jgi:hypothetical protein
MWGRGPEGGGITDEGVPEGRREEGGEMLVEGGVRRDRRGWGMGEGRS